YLRFSEVYFLLFISKMSAELIRLNIIEICSFAFLLIFATFVDFYLNFKGLNYLLLQELQFVAILPYFLLYFTE
ncbi:MAG: hypothetical protein QW307_04865, partial [Thermoplasmata archaeon]